MTFGGAAARALLLTLTLAVGVAWPNQFLFNGGFDPSGPNGWAAFTAMQRALGTTMPTVVSIFTEGEDQSTVFQAPSGQALLQLSIMVQGSTVPGHETGAAQVVIDKMPVAGYDFSGLGSGQVKFTLLDYGFLSDGASHSIGLQFVRPVLVKTNPYYSYVDNTSFFADEPVPEPSTFGLLLAGLGCVMAIRHRRRDLLNSKN